jgi:hypothetical protein
MTRHRHCGDRRRAARLLALAALALGAATLALAVLAASTEFPRGLTVLGCLAMAQFAMLFGPFGVDSARLDVGQPFDCCLRCAC